MTAEEVPFTMTIISPNKSNASFESEINIPPRNQKGKHSDLGINHKGNDIGSVGTLDLGLGGYMQAVSLVRMWVVVLIICH